MTWVQLNARKCWRRGWESNPRVKVLQTSPLPLGYRAINDLQTTPTALGNRLGTEPLNRLYCRPMTLVNGVDINASGWSRP